MASFMELIFIDGDNACQTNMRNEQASDAETWKAFRRARPFAVDIKKATFLLDYHNRKGDLADTIPIDDAGFFALTGQLPKTAAEYQKIDREFWDSVRSAA